MYGLWARPINAWTDDSFACMERRPAYGQERFVFEFHTAPVLSSLTIVAVAQFVIAFSTTAVTFASSMHSPKPTVPVSAIDASSRITNAILGHTPADYFP
jgi:hypothetical protein